MLPSETHSPPAAAQPCLAPLQRVAALEAELAMAKLDADKAAVAHRNLEDVVRSLQEQRSSDRQVLEAAHADEVAAVRTALASETEARREADDPVGCPTVEL